MARRQCRGAVSGPVDARRADLEDVRLPAHHVAGVEHVGDRAGRPRPRRPRGRRRRRRPRRGARGGGRRRTATTSSRSRPAARTTGSTTERTRSSTALMGGSLFCCGPTVVVVLLDAVPVARCVLGSRATHRTSRVARRSGRHASHGTIPDVPSPFDAPCAAGDRRRRRSPPPARARRRRPGADRPRPDADQLARRPAAARETAAARAGGGGAGRLPDPGRRAATTVLVHRGTRLGTVRDPAPVAARPPGPVGQQRTPGQPPQQQRQLPAAASALPHGTRAATARSLAAALPRAAGAHRAALDAASRRTWPGCSPRSPRPTPRWRPGSREPPGEPRVPALPGGAGRGARGRLRVRRRRRAAGAARPDEKAARQAYNLHLSRRDHVTGWSSCRTGATPGRGRGGLRPRRAGH